MDMTIIPTKWIPLTPLIFPCTNADANPKMAPPILLDPQPMRQHLAYAMTITMHVSPPMISMTQIKNMATIKPLMHTTMDTSTTMAIYYTPAMNTIHPCHRISTRFHLNRPFSFTNSPSHYTDTTLHKWQPYSPRK